MSAPTTTQETKRDRSPYYDNLKYVLITLVVVGHFINVYLKGIDAHQGWGLVTTTIRNWIYLFHMPAFIFVSGLFAKSLYKKERGLNVNTITFYFVLYLIFFFAHQMMVAYFGKASFDPFNTNEIPWYLFALAVLGASTPIVANVKLGWKLVIPASILFSVFVGFSEHLGTFMSLGRITSFAPFYYAGYFIDIDWLLGKVKACQRAVWPVVVAALVLLGAGVSFALIAPYDISGTIYRLCLGTLPHHHYSLPIFAAFGRFIWFFIVGGVLACVLLVIPTRKLFFSEWGSRTLQVYILHPFIYKPMVFSGLRAAYCNSDIPLPVVWVVLFAVLLTAVLAYPKFPARLLDRLRRSIRIS